MRTEVWGVGDVREHWLGLWQQRGAHPAQHCLDAGEAPIAWHVGTLHEEDTK